MDLVLGQLAWTRSGDKGDHANLGVVARSEAAYDFLCRELTADRVHVFFAETGLSGVERFELPKVWAFNFLLYNALDGGASRSLRMDTQGKLFGTAALQLPLPWSSEVANLLLNLEEPTGPHEFNA